MLGFFHLFWAQVACNFITFGEHFEVKMLPWAQLEAQGGTSGTQVATRVPQSSKKWCFGSPFWLPFGSFGLLFWGMIFRVFLRRYFWSVLSIFGGQKEPKGIPNGAKSGAKSWYHAEVEKPCFCLYIQHIVRVDRSKNRCFGVDFPHYFPIFPWEGSGGLFLRLLLDFLWFVDSHWRPDVTKMGCCFIGCFRWVSRGYPRS